MSQTTDLLCLPYIMAAQAQKHVTHNEALRKLDAILHLSVRADDASEPSDPPADGDRYIVPQGASGVFEGQDGTIAIYVDGGWTFHAPANGWMAWVEARQQSVILHNGNWQIFAAGGTTGTGGNGETAPRFGINAAADDINRLTVRSAASLFTAQEADHRLTVNRSAQTDVSSLVFQTGFAAGAEIGLLESNFLQFKTGPDGSAMQTALAVHRSTGMVSVPLLANGENLLLNGHFVANGRAALDGYQGSPTYIRDRWKTGTDPVTFETPTAGGLRWTGGEIRQTIEAALWGDLAGHWVTVTLSGLAENAVTVTLAGQSATLQPGQPSVSSSFLLPAQATGNQTLALQPVGGYASIASVKLERGAMATHGPARPSVLEAKLLERYFQRTQPPALGIFMLLTQFSSQDMRGLQTFPTRMRTEPQALFADPAQFRLIPAYGNITVSKLAADELGLTLRVTTSDPVPAGSTALLRSASSGTAAILLDADF